MAVDNEARAYRESTDIVILSVPCPYTKCALTRYLSILFLNILTLLACTQSFDKLLHTLMVVCEMNTLFLHQRVVVPSGNFTFLNF